MRRCSRWLTNILGKVLVAPFTKHSKNTEAKLYSQLLTGPTCLRLEVLMFRRNVNYLSIKIIHKEAQTSSEIVRYNGPQGQQWVPMEHSIFLPESLSYQVKIISNVYLCTIVYTICRIIIFSKTTVSKWKLIIHDWYNILDRDHSGKRYRLAVNHRPW